MMGSTHWEFTVKIADIRANAYSMPFISPAYPKGPYRFVNREFFIITYRTDPELLRAVVPEPLELIDYLHDFLFDCFAAHFV